jgi:hypothetical protein
MPTPSAQSGAMSSVAADAQQRIGQHPCDRGQEGGRQCRRRDLEDGEAEADEDRPEDRAAADPVDAADRPDRQCQDEYLAAPIAIWGAGRSSRTCEGEPGAERHQNGGDDQEKGIALIEQLGPDQAVCEIQARTATLGRRRRRLRKDACVRATRTSKSA